MLVVPGLVSLLHVVGVTVELGDVPEPGATVTLEGRAAPSRWATGSVLRVGNAIDQVVQAHPPGRVCGRTVVLELRQVP